MVGGFVDHARPVPTGHPNTYAIKKFQNLSFTQRSVP